LIICSENLTICSNGDERKYEYNICKSETQSNYIKVVWSNCDSIKYKKKDDDSLGKLKPLLESRK